MSDAPESRSIESGKVLELPLDDIKRALIAHLRYIKRASGGKRADLRFVRMTGMRLEKFMLMEALLTGANFDEAILRGTDFTVADLYGASFVKADLTGCKFRRADMRATVLREAILDGADLTEADLRPGMLIDGRNRRKVASDLEGAQMENTIAQGVDFSGANLRNAVIRTSNLRGANFSGADLSHATIEKTNMQGVNLKGAKLIGTTFYSVHLHGADLQGVDLSTAEVSGTTQLDDAKIEGAVRPLDFGQIGQDLKSVIIAHKDWIASSCRRGARADFSKADLKGRNFEGLDLSGAWFNGANLAGASFRRCRLIVAEFRDALLENADFRETVLSGANFSGANLRGADFTDAKLAPLRVTMRKENRVQEVRTRFDRAKLTNAKLPTDAEKKASFQDTVH